MCRSETGEQRRDTDPWIHGRDAWAAVNCRHKKCGRNADADIFIREAAPKIHGRDENDENVDEGDHSNVDVDDGDENEEGNDEGDENEEGNDEGDENDEDADERDQGENKT